MTWKIMTVLHVPTKDPISEIHRSHSNSPKAPQKKKKRKQKKRKGTKEGKGSIMAEIDMCLVMQSLRQCFACVGPHQQLIMNYVTNYISCQAMILELL